MTPQELQENFAMLDDWESRYGYVLDLGKRLPNLPDVDKCDANIVRGCTSQVWMIPSQAPQGHVGFTADSDAHLVRGLIAILSVVYNQQSFDHVSSFDIAAYFDQLGLTEHLTPNRRNGFFSMVERIKGMAHD
jgi:cysteine desulfuration protein SufE